MIEVELIGGSAFDASTLVSLPNLLLHSRRNEASPMCIVQGCRLCGLIALVALDSNELELEDASRGILLAPAVHQMKVTVVRPDARTKFLINANDIRPFPACFKLLCCSRKLAVLGGPP